MRPLARTFFAIAIALASLTTLPAFASPVLESNLPPYAASGGFPNTCFGTPDDGTTVYSSTTASAVRQAIGAAGPGATVKVAGYCPGVASENGTDQVALITQPLTLAGGYTPTNWATAYPMTQPTTFDAMGGGRGIYANAAATLQGLVIVNGVTNEGGGGIWAGSTVNLSSVTFISNSASSAGGGASIVGQANVSGSTFMSNTSSQSGGGAWFFGPASIVGSTFMSNSASQMGGGAWFFNPASIVGSAFMSNTSGQTGGGAQFSGAASVTATVFAGNIALQSGGGASFFADSVSVSASAFSGNSAGGDGGGVSFGVAVANRIVNSIFMLNTASGSGAAINIDDGGELSLVHNTIAAPSLVSGAAIYTLGGHVRMTNTLISNYAVGIRRYILGSVFEDYTLFSGVGTPYLGVVNSGGHSITGTAGFVNPAVGDYHLGPGSSAISAGMNAGVATDFEGTPRPIGAGFDIGYDEYIQPRAWLPLLRR